MYLTNILEVNNLVTSFQTEAGRVRAVDGVSFSVKKGKTLGIVGESGCGKSVSSLSIMRLLPKPSGVVESGEILLQDNDILQLETKDLYKIRGRKISMIFQEPMTALNPVHSVGKQISEIFKIHFPKMNSGEVLNKSVEMLRKVGIPDPEKRFSEYPHQLSGGMRQRIMIAMALSTEPEILIADEPTTALDVTIQAQILKLMQDLQKETGMSIIFITHDLGVIAEVCDDVVVMYAGKIIEKAPVIELFKNPKHPYTIGLLNSIPRLENKRKTKLNCIDGAVPGLLDIPKGCRFQNRCEYKISECEKKHPDEIEVRPEHYASCIFPEGLK
ncbi:MAG: ABC transporter ATP-binding protein [Desulfobacterales bacterium]|nr:ABC transporter ATP-binding protein [Desulfobacterales bacterium]MCP4159250.1 ABC transporter ATP-binding protein [Deltaproteobacteria bacterium]